MNGTVIALSAILVICWIIVGPLLCIWALNTLFGLSIVYTFKTWAATLVLMAVVNGAKASAKS